MAQIAEQAGLTKSTFFRYFPDKREVLAAGQGTLSQLLSEGIAGAPAAATPLEAVAAALAAVAGAFTPERRDLGQKMQAAIAASGELQERDTLKRVGLATAMTTALKNEEFQMQPPASRPKSDPRPEDCQLPLGRLDQRPGTHGARPPITPRVADGKRNTQLTEQRLPSGS